MAWFAALLTIVVLAVGLAVVLITGSGQLLAAQATGFAFAVVGTIYELLIRFTNPRNTGQGATA